jgi:hypothetical protein
MAHNTPFGNPFGRVPGRSWLCLLLAISFLFNPFLAVSASTLGTIVSHLPSFRSTVASSELLKFAPQQKIGEQASPECELPSWFEPYILPQIALRQFGKTERSASVLYAPSGNVWFRPPPVA